MKNVWISKIAVGTALVILQNESLVAQQKSTEEQQPLIAQPQAMIDPKILDSYVGQYELSQDSANAVLDIGRLGDHLYYARKGLHLWIKGENTGISQLEIFPKSENEFFAKIVPIQITFLKDSEGKVTGLIVHQNGEQTARRLPTNR